MVEFNVVKLELFYVRQCVYKAQHNVVSLEKQRLELESAIKDRLELVSSQRQRMITLRRNLESERMRLSMELKDRLAYLGRLRSRSVLVHCQSLTLDNWGWCNPGTSTHQGSYWTSGAGVTWGHQHTKCHTGCIK